MSPNLACQIYGNLPGLTADTRAHWMLSARNVLTRDAVTTCASAVVLLPGVGDPTAVPMRIRLSRPDPVKVSTRLGGIVTTIPAEK